MATIDRRGIIVGEAVPSASEIWQNVTDLSEIIAAATTLVTVQRVSPTATSLILPSIYDRARTRISIIDWSTSVTDHTITLTPDGSETIMQAASWAIYSNSAQLGSLTIYPSTVLNGWYIAP